VISRRTAHRAAPTWLLGRAVLRISRTTVVLGGLALAAWVAAAILVGFQMDQEVPAPLGSFVAIIAATLTIVTAHVARRDGPAVRIEPAPLNVVFPRPAPVEPPTVVNVVRGPLCSTPRREPMSWTRVYESAHAGGAQLVEISVDAERRSQDYWDGVSDCAETLFEARDDDPA
jgi:hypothetical protein